MQKFVLPQLVRYIALPVESVYLVYYPETWVLRYDGESNQHKSVISQTGLELLPQKLLLAGGVGVLL